MQTKYVVAALGLAWLAAMTPPAALAAQGDCGQPLSNGPSPSPLDALFVLRTVVGVDQCELSVCDVDGSCTFTASDALRVLRLAVGLATEVDCAGPCQTSTTSSSTSSTLGTSTSTTTTTLPATWTEVHAIMTQRMCATVGCHATTVPGGELADLDDFDLGYANLVNTGVFCSPSAFSVRVVPGNPQASFLLAKLNGTHDCGVQMPSGAPVLIPPLSPAEIESVRSWIGSGAPKN